MCKQARLGINPNYFRFASQSDFYLNGVKLLDIETIRSGTKQWLQEIFALRLNINLKFGTSCYTSDDIGSFNRQLQMSYKGVDFPIFLVYPCSRCNECLSSKVAQAEARCLLEASVRPYVFFATFTYDDKNLPDGGNLCPSDMSKYFNKLRANFRHSRYKEFQNLDFSWFCVGEYGGKTQRPHYHVLFYFDSYIPHCLFKAFKLIFLEVWNKGEIFKFESARSNAALSRYCVKYIMKQQYIPEMKDKDVPCYFRCSRRPAFGASPEIIEKYRKAILHSTDGTILVNVRHQNSLGETYIKPTRVVIPKILVDKIWVPLSRTYPKVVEKYLKYELLTIEIDERLNKANMLAHSIYGPTAPFLEHFMYLPISRKDFKFKYRYFYTNPCESIKESLLSYEVEIHDYSFKQLQNSALEILNYFTQLPTLNEILLTCHDKQIFYLRISQMKFEDLVQMKAQKLQRLDRLLKVRYDLTH